MKNRSSHNSIWFRLGALLTLLALATFWVSTPHSLAQQDNRQLKRDQTQPNGASARRLALVIGNGAYTNAPTLKNPPNDARDMAATLRALGFEVSSGINVNQRDMKRLIREFGQKLKAGGSGLFYYAGHGVQSKGRNYLIPVEADIQSEIEAEDAGVDVSLVLGYMDDAQNGLNIVILDACRNNPFARSFRSASSGLAQVDAAYETAGLDLQGTQLVVLSACDTGVGEVKVGEGVYGLRRALVIAGAESQVTSLWQVDDAATRDLMVDFYTRLQKSEGRGEALRNAQLNMLKSTDRSHPYY